MPEPLRANAGTELSLAPWLPRARFVDELPEVRTAVALGEASRDGRSLNSSLVARNGRIRMLPESGCEGRGVGIRWGPLSRLIFRLSLATGSSKRTIGT